MIERLLLEGSNSFEKMEELFTTVLDQEMRKVLPQTGCLNSVIVIRVNSALKFLFDISGAVLRTPPPAF